MWIYKWCGEGDTNNHKMQFGSGTLPDYEHLENQAYALEARVMQTLVIVATVGSVGLFMALLAKCT